MHLKRRLYHIKHPIANAIYVLLTLVVIANIIIFVIYAKEAKVSSSPTIWAILFYLSLWIPVVALYWIGGAVKDYERDVGWKRWFNETYPNLNHKAIEQTEEHLRGIEDKYRGSVRYDNTAEAVYTSLVRESLGERMENKFTTDALQAYKYYAFGIGKLPEPEEYK
ncbi:MAG: hypothetical protein PHS53_01200 [Candidatus Pacebacteria bacterium]|nr:hypothetical protein [Candidatus Paceibacterota bacterium]MDD5356749.1 hypothetical protein [Candidatus Paceibacterota bacterium]